MAIANRNSTIIADQVASPKVLVSPSKGSPAPLVSTSGYVANAADDDATSIHRFCRIPSNAAIRQVLFSTGDAVTGGAINLGIYRTAGDGGAVVDAGLFAAAFALINGPYSNTDLTFQSGQYTQAEAVKPLWEVLGLTADPLCDYDVAATISTTYAGAAVGQLVTVNYVV